MILSISRPLDETLLSDPAAYLGSNLVQLPVPLSSTQDCVFSPIGDVTQRLLNRQDIPLDLVYSELRREADISPG